MLTYLNPNSNQPQLKFNKSSTQPHTNLTSTSASYQPQPQYLPHLNLNLNLNLTWLLHKSILILLHFAFEISPRKDNLMLMSAFKISMAKVEREEELGQITCNM